MLFEKLFRLLVLGGVMAGAASGCAANAQVPAQKKAEAKDGGAAPDAGAAKPADDSGGGAPGW